MESVKELLEVGKAFFGATPFWPVIKTLGALVIIATLLRMIGDRLPFIPAGLRVGMAWSAKLLVRTARASAGALQSALTYKRAREPRWVKPLSLFMDLLLGGYFGLLFFLLFVQFSGFVVFADSSQAWWKYIVATVSAVVLLVAAKVFTIQARDAWCEIRDRYLGGPRGGAGGPKLLPAARTSPVDP